jgi:methyltransferase (TIGR00027 family)
MDTMSPSSGEISHVSDTALLVAACRALESEGADAFIHDPFAERLAGERGKAILREFPRAVMLRFGIGVRTRFLDDLLQKALVSAPVATVLSLGCGLDTRPWRLDLPPDLRWIEVDFADMLDYKEALLADETPRCRRERLTADLNDPAARKTIYDAVQNAPALMITEGLLMYLPGSTVEALAAEVGQENAIGQWMLDITSSQFTKAVGMDSVQSLRDVQAADCLSGEKILEATTRHGWVTAARRSYLTDMDFAMDRVRRMIGAGPGPASPPPPSDPSGVYRLSKV